MSAFDDDIDTMLEDFDPVWLTSGLSSGNAISDEWDEDVLRGTEKGVAAGSLALMIKTSAFPDLKINGEVTVQQLDANGAPIATTVKYYRVLDRQRPVQYADGAVTHILLQAL